MSRVMGLNKFGPSWRYLAAFYEFPKIKSSPKTGVSQITKYLNINTILTSQNNMHKIIASMTCFCKNFISSQTSKLPCIKNLLCKWRHCPTVTTLPDLTVPSCKAQHLRHVNCQELREQQPAPQRRWLEQGSAETSACSYSLLLHKYSTCVLNPASEACMWTVWNGASLREGDQQGSAETSARS
jgi:hypothetical protein